MKTSKKTKFFGITTCVAMVLSLFSTPMTQIKAETSKPITPTTETIENKQLVFANGVPITITQKDGNTNTVTWDGGTMDISTTATVFGGTHDSDTTLQNTSVTMNSGTVNAIFGGGLHKSHVVNSNVTINGGSIPSQVAGGGASSFVHDSHSWYSGEATNSPCIVENANVTINGGDKYYLVYGGGEGISKTGTTTLTINDGNFSKAYVTAGGSNGYTGTATLNINGGTSFNVVQSVNRGSMDSAVLNVTGGEIINLYLGGETGDSGVTGTISNVKADITGGKITNIQKGKSNNIEFSKDSNALSLTYHRSFIQNAASIAETFGTSAIDTFDDSIKNIILDKSEVILQQGETDIIKAEVTSGADATEEQKKITWSSNHPEIATVKDGKIIAVAAGKATITAKTESGVEATCTVTVTKPVEVETPPVINPEIPVDKIEVGVTDEKAKETIKNVADKIIAGDESVKDYTSEETAKAVVEAVQDGKAISVAAVVEEADTEKEEVKADTAKIQEELETLTADSKATATVAMYLDLNLQIKADEDVIGNVTKLDVPVTFTVLVPENLQQEGRTFYVLRVHNGGVEKLNTKVEGNTLTFKTDRFSTYAIVYEDQKKEDTTTPDPTPEPTPTPDSKPTPTPTPDSKPTPTPTPTPTPEKTFFKVVFVDKNGATLSVANVEENGTAVAPIAPVVEGYRFVKWDTDFTKVTKDLTVKPVYEKITDKTPAASPEKTSKNKNSPNTGDTTNAALFTAFALLGLVSMGIVAVQRKRKQLMK